MLGLNLGLLLLRLVVGLYLFGHGTQKLWGWFGGGGMAATRSSMQRLGFRPAPLWALVAALGETGGGLLLAAGLLAPLGAITVAATMLVATVSVHVTKGVWAAKGGIELPFTNLTAALALALVGSGAWTLDRLLGIALPRTLVLLGVGGVALLVVLIGLVTRRPPDAPDPTPATSPK
ncbi:MAG TPA: DoxX family membrane protein [Candidatus Nitrosotalea sp.]|nr:DoxX family membrane protein [Candidatus Nitrosotalea sp.]